MKTIITKLFINDTIKSIDEKARTAEYIISSDEVDRMGEIVEQSWQLDNYKKNPIVLWGHNPDAFDNVLGKCIELETKKDGARTVTVAKVQFAEEGTSRGVDTVWKLVKQGILKTVSVGFIPHKFQPADGDTKNDTLSDNELLEFSIVPIPANPNAVALAYTDGSITKKDADWLIKTYENEKSFLTKTICDKIKSNNETAKIKESKVMTDEEITKLADVLGKSVSDSLKPTLDKILEAVGDKKPEEDEDNTNSDAENQEDQDKIGKVADDTNAKKSEQPEEAFDENEELNEEEQKQFLKELEQEYSKGEI